MAKRVYVSLPISGYDLKERREYAQRVEDSLGHFYDTVNPMMNDKTMPPVLSPTDIKPLWLCNFIHLDIA